MRVSLEYPWLLCLLPVCIGIVLYQAGSLRIGSRAGKITAFTLRILLFAMIVGALAGISVTKKSEKTTTIFLIDASESFRKNRQEAVEMVQQALEQMPKGEQAGVVAFGGNTSIEQFVAQKASFSGIESVPVETETNLEKAVQTALSLYPEEAGKRLVLLTDGSENAGDICRMSSSVLAAQIDVQVIQREDIPDQEVYLSDLSVPEAITPGETFSVQIEVESTIQTGAIVQLYNDKTLRRQEKVDLQKGTNLFSFQDRREEKGFAFYRAVVMPDQDTVQTNNEYVAYTEANEQQKILLIEGKQRESVEFQRVLRAAGISFEVVQASGASVTMSQLTSYAAVVTENVYVTDLPDGFLDSLEAYVRDYGGGFIAIGGDQSFALGGYKDTPMEKVLPVNMDLTGEKDIPKVAMAMVIDRSGSMTDSAQGKTKLQLAKEAAAAAVENLRDTDIVGIESFDDKYQWNVKMQELSDREEVNRKIFGISDQGGATSIFPALKEAYEQIAKTDAEIKHVILLTDGQDEYRQYDSLLNQMNQKSITLSTVAIGMDSDLSLLESLAEKGKGRSYQTKNGEELSRIFAQEVYLSEKEYLVNRDFTPVITADSAFLQEVVQDGLPVLRGYVGTSLKDHATAIWMDDKKEDPVLAEWQYGLGKTVAFTSDVTGEWTGNYSDWENYPVLWANLVREVLQEKKETGSKITAKQEGSAGLIRYENGAVDSNARVTAVYTDQEGKQQEITLDSVSSGIYEGEIPLSQTGVYSVNVRCSENGKVKEAKNVQLTMQYSAEYRFGEQSRGLDQFLAETGGTKQKDLQTLFAEKPAYAVAPKDLTVWLLTAAVLLWMLDIINRRIPFFCDGIWLKRLRGDDKKVSRIFWKNSNKDVTGEQKRSAIQNLKREKASVESRDSSEEMLDVGALLKKKKERERK